VQTPAAHAGGGDYGRECRVLEMGKPQKHISHHTHILQNGIQTSVFLAILRSKAIQISFREYLAEDEIAELL
jgi:hypothetical protein